MRHRTLFYYNMLEDAEKQDYKRIVDGIWNYHDRISVNTFDVLKINRILQAVLNDHPDLFWFEGKWKKLQNRSGIEIEPMYVNRKEKEALLLKEKALLIRQIQRCAGEKRGYQIPGFIYDVIIDTIEYKVDSLHSQNVYGAFVEKKAVCKGIAKAFQILAQEWGIPCSILKGTIDGKTGHMWNVLWLNHTWYHVDVSMGYDSFQTLRSQMGGGEKAYLGLTSRQIKKTHRWNAGLFYDDSKGGV